MSVELHERNKSAQYRKEFLTFCRENKNDKDAKDAEARRIWEEHKPVKVDAHVQYHADYADVKVDQMNSRSNHGVQNALPSFKLSSFNLNLWNDLSLIVMVSSIVAISIVAIVDVSLMATSTIEWWLFIAIFSIGSSVVVSVVIFDMTKYRYIEKFDKKMVELEAKLKTTIKMFKRAYNRSRFKNGNIKWGVFEKELNEWYKHRIIHHLDNPYEVEIKKQNIASDLFITSGGVYAWWVEDQVVYIGKANNFKRRMKEHTAGLNHTEEYNERKYNVGLTTRQVDIQILAITNDEDEQSVLESYYFEKYNDGQLLNATGTLTWKKIMTKEKYREAWDRIKSKVNN